MKLFFTLLSLISISFASSLQKAIDNALPYSTVKLSTGVYEGNIVIKKPLTLLGKSSGVIIKGDGTGTVITINSSDVILKNLTITNSGKRVDKIDSAISLNNASHCEINSCNIKDTHYGIEMSMVKNSSLLNNSISTRKDEISLKGDGLKIYYSNNNIIKNNTIEHVRDITLSYSHNNSFENNTFLHNRFATHLSLSNNNIFKDNIYRYNSVAIILTMAKNTKIIHNTIESSTGAAGIGVVLKGVMNLLFEKNRLRFNAKGIYIDGQEKEKGIKRHIFDNEISHNAEAIHFHAYIKDNNITYNKIFANIDDVVKDTRGNFFPNQNIVKYNYWDRYVGFDKDKNNIGDTPHKIYQYSDRLWQHNNKIKFFYASPIMSIIDFLYAIAPFVEPNLLFEDSSPVFNETKPSL